jgi:hypothetical protein
VGYTLTAELAKNADYSDIVIAYDPVNQGFKFTQTDKTKVAAITVLRVAQMVHQSFSLKLRARPFSLWILNRMFS